MSSHQPEGSGLWVALATVLGVSFVGFAAGTSTQRAKPAPLPEVEKLGQVASGASGGSTIAQAKPYSKLRETNAKEPRVVTPARLEASGQEPEAFGPPPPPEQVAGWTARRAERRAWDGAPPTIPHPVAHGFQRDSTACLACHGQGLEIGSLRAGFPSHHPMSSCTQCHVPGDRPVPPAWPGTGERPDTHKAWGGGVAISSLPVAPVTPWAAPRGDRAWEGAPPTIPHGTFLRERCLACHGPTGPDPIRSSHPWRQSCAQCHVPSLESVP